jgi:hypothetical protein
VSKVINIILNMENDKNLNFEEYDWFTKDPVQNAYYITKNDICYKDSENEKLFSGLENIDSSGLSSTHLTNPEGIKFSHIYSGKNTIIHGGGIFIV